MGNIVDSGKYLALVSYWWTFAGRRNCPRAQPVSVLEDKDFVEIFCSLSYSSAEAKSKGKVGSRKSSRIYLSLR